MEMGDTGVGSWREQELIINDRLDMALHLCDAVKESGADVVKFQT